MTGINATGQIIPWNYVSAASKPKVDLYGRADTVAKSAAHWHVGLEGRTCPRCVSRREVTPLPFFLPKRTDARYRSAAAAPSS